MGNHLVIRRKGKLGLRLGLEQAQRSDPYISINDWAQMMGSFSYNGVQFSLSSAPQEEIGSEFPSLVNAAYKANGVVFACMLLRQLVFSEARFQFRNIRNGRPGDLFGTADLAPLETPGPGETTADMLTRMIQHADLGGNWFGTSRYGGITTLRPDWMTIIAGSEYSDVSMWDPSVQILGYSWKPGGPASDEDPIAFLPEEIAHFAPIPDPVARWRGMSWLTPVIREVMSDKAFTDHKLAFTEQGATPNGVVKFPIEDVSKFEMWIQKFREQHEGADNAYKTLFLGAGMDYTPVGTDFQTLDIKAVQGAGETRIAAAAGTPPVLVGLSEGLAAATYSNYGMARRRFADMTIRPLWRNAAGSLARIVTVPGGSELWYDDRDIPFVREDEKDAAEIESKKASTINSLIINGFEPDSAVTAVLAGDLSQLKHSGLVSVQLQEPGTTLPDQSGPLGSTTPQQSGPPVKQNGNRSDHDDETRALLSLLELAVAERKPPSVTFEEGAFRFDAPAPADINVHLPEQAAPSVTFEEGAFQARFDVPEQEPPVVNVDVNLPEPRATKKTVDFGDGRTATVVTEPNGGDT